MRKTLLILSVFFFSFTIESDKPVDRIGVTGPLKFSKTSFNLAWADKPNDKYYIQEYLPKGEKLESFNQMLTIHLFDIDIKTKDAVNQKINELTEKKKIDPTCNYQLIESPDGKEFIVTFFLGESKNDKMTIVEFNIYRYKQIEIAKKKKAIIVYTYSKRGYGADITAFFDTLKTERINYLNEMISVEIPKIRIEK